MKLSTITHNARWSLPVGKFAQVCAQFHMKDGEDYVGDVVYRHDNTTSINITKPGIKFHQRKYPKMHNLHVHRIDAT